jgi:putative endonuclease
MAWVYILRNIDTDRYYIGSTIDLNRRLKQHRSGNTRTTRILKTYELAYTEEYVLEKEAREREKQIKAHKSKIYIKKLINRVGSSTVEQ